MRVEEYGIENEKVIVMLHGAYFVHTFGRQYPLAEQYHIMVPHIMGFGNHTDTVFETEACVKELADFIKKIGRKVMLVGFSLGAQLAFKLVAEYTELFDCALIVSPWLIKNTDFLSQMEQTNLKQLRQMKTPWFCRMIGLMNGLPKGARKEFAEHMQQVTEETIHNVVYSDISIESVPSFANVAVPIVVIAGEKEPPEVTDSVKRMAQINACCRYEIWKKAAHNIPPMFYKKLNALICAMY